MKISLYIEDGLEQIVLTPENKTESSILEKLHDGSRMTSIKRGSFFRCQGGWVRHGIYNDSNLYSSLPENDDSTMIVLERYSDQNSDGYNRELNSGAKDAEFDTVSMMVESDQ